MHSVEQAYGTWPMLNLREHVFAYLSKRVEACQFHIAKAFWLSDTMPLPSRDRWQRASQHETGRRGNTCTQLQETAGEGAGRNGIPGVLLAPQRHQSAVKCGEQASPHRKAAAYPGRFSPNGLSRDTGAPLK